MKRTTNYSEKPYNRCLQCPHRKVRCDGPRTSSMELLRWCEYMRDIKELEGLTNAYVAEQSGVSIKTIERIMALNVEQDIMRDTARRIEDVIIGSSNKYPCYLAFEEENAPVNQKMSDALRELEYALKDNEEYHKALDDIHDSYNLEINTIRQEARAREDDLKDQIARLRIEVDNLWKENNRKGRMIDKILDQKNITFIPLQT